MSKITKDDINATFQDITYFIEVKEYDDAQAFVADGMRILAIHTCQPESDYPFIYCVGWPSSLGEVSDHVLRYGGGV